MNERTWKGRRAVVAGAVVSAVDSPCADDPDRLAKRLEAEFGVEVVVEVVVQTAADGPGY